MSTPNYFYRDKENREIGPLPMSAIAQLRQAGILTDETPVRLDNAVEWLTCKTVMAIAGSSSGATSVSVGNTSSRSEKGSGIDMQKIVGQSWILFALAGLSFTLPFFGIPSIEAISVTGQQLILGDKALGLAPYQYPAVIVAFALTILGLVLSLSRKRQASKVSGLLGISAIIALVIARDLMGDEASQKAKSIIEFDFRGGFWFVAIFLSIAAIGLFKYGGVDGNGKDNHQKLPPII